MIQKITTKELGDKIDMNVKEHQKRDREITTLFYVK
jgi:hypothetical protein